MPLHPCIDACRLVEMEAVIDRLRKERDAAFFMSRCECSADECCGNLTIYRDALNAVANLARCRTDDEAEVAHINGLIRQMCKTALMGPNV